MISFLKIALAEQYSLTIFSNHTIDIVKTNKEKKFSISKAIGSWQDSLGNYGSSLILFYIDAIFNKDGSVRGLAELTNQFGSKVWFAPSRSDNLKDAGVGKMVAIEAENDYKFLLDKKCTYAIKYIEERSFIKVICK